MERLTNSRSSKKQNICAYVLLVVCISAFLISGCTVNKVSLMLREETGETIKYDKLKWLPSLTDVDQPWQIEGMISAYTLPTSANSIKKRKALIQKTISALGINAVLGLQENVGQSVGGTGRSNALLVNIGHIQNKKSKELPKFIVCFPRTNFTAEVGNATEAIDKLLLDHIQYFFSYRKGYYVYRCDDPIATNANIFEGKTLISTLGSPLGVEPDYALLLDVIDYEVQGSNWTGSSTMLKITMTLFDLTDRKPLWTASTEGMHKTNILSGFIGGLGVGIAGAIVAHTDENLEARRIVRKAIFDVLETLPPAKGFKGGPISPTYRY